MRAGGGMSRLTRPATPRRPEEAILAAHWLSDAVAGILLGTSCALLSAVVVDGLQRRWRARGAREAEGPAGAHVPEEARRADGP